MPANRLPAAPPGRLRVAPARRLLAALALLAGLAPAAAPLAAESAESAGTAAASHRYALQPRQVAADTWVIVGRTEDFSRVNGADIVNTAFIDTGDGVLVIDTGATRRYGEALRAAIASVTKSPIRAVWITHHHPDHFLGNQAFEDVPIAALQQSIQGIRAEGNAFAENVYRMAGDWAKGTEVLAPQQVLETGERQLGRHRFRLYALAGHTAADLAVFDETTGVLFAGDLAFHDRAPTTPHADIGRWLASLDVLAAMPYKVLVPGHGLPSTDDRPLTQTRRWLTWLDATLARAASEGLDAAEVLALPMPEDLARLPLARSELTRSLAHLYRRLEAGAVAQER